MEAFPNAKVILSVRDPKKWHLSVKNTIYNIPKLRSRFPTNIFFALTGSLSRSDMISRITAMPTNGIDKGIILFITKNNRNYIFSCPRSGLTQKRIAL